MLYRNTQPESVKDNNTTKRIGILSFGLGWRDKNKVSILDYYCESVIITNKTITGGKMGGVVMGNRVSQTYIFF